MIMRPAAVLTVALLFGCSSTPHPYEADMIDVTLPAPAEQVRTAVTQVLTEGGYDVEWKDEQTVHTGYREETRGPWDWLYLWRFGTIKSRVEGMVTPSTDQSTRVRLHVLTQGKDGIFMSWKDQQSALPQSADNQLRLIKNALNIL
ncbi:hypothetical protein [Nitrospira moscoviensis]|uniref:Lipoprotein n=1 Tax=Nitrospira moscoviensis TaxID=42253 RepID=A0A0K2G9E7_NITMO|nr:hypothetical protein [Nitrospira moscoviensis]ALA57596.1 conserved exported protein of unknown function [Nitrospira moscoviensis]